MPKITLRPSGANNAVLALSGAIDEEFETMKIDLGASSEIEINLTEVSRMNSRGLRGWLRWMGSLDRNRAYSLVGCPHIMVSIAGLVADLFPKWMKLKSVEIPYTCETCGHSFSSMYTLKSQDTIPADVASTKECEKCHAQAEVGVAPDIYFRFLTSRK